MIKPQKISSSWPGLAAGMRVGLYGGSFDPIHAGHELVARRAMRRLGLDQLWWIPSHGNPLKSRQPRDYAIRAAEIRMRLVDPRQRVHDIEALSGSRYTGAQVMALKRRYPGVRFVLIIGADLVNELPRWRGWRQIAAMIPIAVIARPGHQLRAGLSQFATVYADARLHPSDAGALQRINPPAWCLITGEMRALSSTAQRRANFL